MPRTVLTDARVKALRPRPSAHDIRDTKLRGFGVRVMPSGARRFFIHAQHRGQRIWNIVGDAGAMTVDEARSRAGALLAAIRAGADAPAPPDATRFETVAETVFRRYARVWKPRTHYVNRHYLHRQILPRFADTQVAGITRAAKLAVLALQRLEPLTLGARQPWTTALVAFGLTHPLAQRLAGAPNLLRDRPHRRPLRVMCRLVLQHHANRSFPHLRECLFEELIALSSQVINSPEFSARFTFALRLTIGRGLVGVDPDVVAHPHAHP